MKKPTGSVLFRFFKPGTGKTEPNRTEKKPEKNRAKTEPNQKNRAKTEPNRAKTEPNQKNRAKPEKTKPNRAKTGKTEPNRFEPVFSLKNRTETGRFEPVSVFFFLKKNFGLITFFDKNRTEPNREHPY